MKKCSFITLIAVLVFPAMVWAQTPSADTPLVSAKGVAIYGWKDGVPTPLYVKNEHRLYPIASITKLITAKVAEELYEPDKVFTISKSAVATYGTTAGIKLGAKFTRDDLLKALLVHSSNDAATALMEPVGRTAFLKQMNKILHDNKYTSTSFINPSGLDPSRRDLRPNRMTPYHLTRLLSDIYRSDPFLVDLMSKETVEITDLASNTTAILKQTNTLYRDESYRDKILMSKTGLTDLAGQNVAFISPGGEEYDYVSVVILGSKSRATDSRVVIDWLTNTKKLAMTNLGG